MTDRVMRRHIEIKDGDRTVAAAVVSASSEAGGASRASLHAWSGHVSPGSRARLVDTILDLPEVQESGRLEVSVPIGDSESLERFRQRCANVSLRAAGATALLDATGIPPVPVPAPAPEPG
jgi:hypothetical protein